MRYTVRMDSRIRKTLDRLPGDMHGRVMCKSDTAAMYTADIAMPRHNYLGKSWGAGTGRKAHHKKHRDCSG